MILNSRYRRPGIDLELHIMIRIAIGKQKENRISLDIAILDFSISFKNPFDRLKYKFLIVLLVSKQVKIQIHRKTGQTIKEIGTGTTLEAKKRSDRWIGKSVLQNSSHDQLVPFSIQHVVSGIFLSARPTVDSHK